MFRSFVAVMLGFMAIIVLLVLGNGFAVKVYGAGPAVGKQVFVFSVAVNLVASFLGGLFTAYLAGERRVRHGYVLAIVLLMIRGLAAVRHPVLGAPVQQILLLIGSPAMAVAGAWVSERAALRSRTGRV